MSTSTVAKKFVIEGELVQGLEKDVKGPKWLLEGLNKAKKEILIVSGELSPKAYNQQVVSKIKEKLAAGVRVKILTGPVIYGGNGEENLIWKLWKENASVQFSLCFLKERPSPHFIIADGRWIALEDQHCEMEPKRSMMFIDNSFFEVRRHEKIFNEMLGKSCLATQIKEIGRVKLYGEEFTQFRLLD